MKKNKLNVGVVGCGRVFLHYLKLFKKNKIPLMELVSCCDINNKKLNSFKYKNISKYLNFNEMLKNEKLDLILILTPSGLHYKHSKMALLKKKNVLCEKPMCLKVSHGKELIKIAKRKKVFYGVVFQNRLNNAITCLKKNIDKNNIGKIIFCNVRLIWSRDNNYYNDGWHGTWKMDGGVLNQQLIHHLDAMINIVSEIDEINSFSSTRINKLECEDSIIASFKLKNGALGQVLGTTGFRPNDTEASIELITDKGLFKVGGTALNKISNWVINGKENKKHFQKFNEKIENSYGNGHEKLLNKLSKKLIYKKKIDEFSWSSSKAFATSIAVSKIYKCIETKKNVRFKDNNFSSKLG